MATLLCVATSGAMAADGQAVYSQNCAACHTSMSPKLGDKVAWAPLIKEGTDALVASTIKGKGAMPPRGGHANLSDADIKAAVAYMESQGQ
jgi:cytochrome c5